MDVQAAGWTAEVGEQTPDRQRGRRRGARHPQPGGEQGIALLGEHPRGRTVGEDPVGGEDDETVDQSIRGAAPRPQPPIEAVLDDDEGAPAVLHRAGDRGPHERGGGVVEHRGRLVEQQRARTHREHPREGETLGLTPGERGAAMVDAVGEPDRGERLGDAGPDLRPGQPEVLRPERGVPTHATGDERVGGVLHEQADASVPRTHGVTVDEHLPRTLAGVDLPEHPGERLQQRRLARPARPGEQHALPGVDAQIEVGEHRRRAPQRRP